MPLRTSRPPFQPLNTNNISISTDNLIHSTPRRSAEIPLSKEAVKLTANIPQESSGSISKWRMRIIKITGTLFRKK